MSTVLCYIAGPYSDASRARVERNIRFAEALALDVAELGALPVCAHTMCSHPGFEIAQPRDFWINATLELLRRCDACLMVPGWETSEGATGERRLAGEMRLPTFDTFDAFRDWFTRRGSVRPGRTA